MLDIQFNLLLLCAYIGGRPAGRVALLTNFPYSRRAAAYFVEPPLPRVKLLTLRELGAIEGLLERGVLKRGANANRIYTPLRSIQKYPPTPLPLLYYTLYIFEFIILYKGLKQGRNGGRNAGRVFPAVQTNS